MKILWLIFGAPILAIVLTAAFFATYPFTRQVIVVNASGGPIANGLVEIGKERVAIPALPDGGEYRIRYRLRGAGDYHLVVTTREGRRLEDRLGYIQEPPFGMQGPDILVISSSRLFQTDRDNTQLGILSSGG